jgi:cytochrome c oxidase subunit 2
LKSGPSNRWWFTIVLLLVLTVAVAGGLLYQTLYQSRPSLAACPPECPYTFSVPTIFAPASDETSRIRSLFQMIIAIAAVVFVLVEGVLVYTVLKYRNRPPETAVQLHGNNKLELAWTAAPAVILAVIMGFTFRTMAQVKGPATGQVLNVKAIGQQYWWAFEYPRLEIVTASELVVPLGATVEVEIESVDVEHGLWAPELFGKVDAVPGYTTRLRFTPQEVGRQEYGGQCTQYCGTQHAQMRFSVIVLPSDEFWAWAANQREPAVEPAAGSAAERGKAAFLNTANLCTSCHTINGTAAAGKVGPNLTHLANRSYIAGGVLTLSEQNLHTWLRDPQAVKPGNKMAVKLDKQTVQDLVAYLITLK